MKTLGRHHSSEPQFEQALRGSVIYQRTHSKKIAKQRANVNVSYLKAFCFKHRKFWEISFHTTL